MGGQAVWERGHCVDSRGHNVSSRGQPVTDIGHSVADGGHSVFTWGQTVAPRTQTVGVGEVVTPPPWANAPAMPAPIHTPIPHSTHSAVRTLRGFMACPFSAHHNGDSKRHL